MKHILTIGEFLIDMLPSNSGISLTDVASFIKMPGGAPINVAVGIKRLEGSVDVVTQVGNDAFGHFLKKTLENEQLSTDYVYMTDKAKTSLAFVSLDEKGERDFVFYRDPSADQLLDISTESIEKMSYDMIHFGSVGLSPYPLKDTTDRFIEHATVHEKIISFDVNVRAMLFKDLEAYKEIIKMYVKKAHVIKFSKEEIIWITQKETIEDAVRALWHPTHQIILVSDGEHGVYAFTKDDIFFQDAFKVEVVDTTGAGDALMGTFLYYLSLQEKPFEHIDSWIKHALHEASYAGALAVTKKGAMSSLPYLYEIIKK